MRDSSKVPSGPTVPATVSKQGTLYRRRPRHTQPLVFRPPPWRLGVPQLIKNLLKKACAGQWVIYYPMTGRVFGRFSAGFPIPTSLADGRLTAFCLGSAA